MNSAPCAISPVAINLDQPPEFSTFDGTTNVFSRIFDSTGANVTSNARVFQ